jgi:hypothetical protein
MGAVQNFRPNSRRVAHSIAATYIRNFFCLPRRSYHEIENIIPSRRSAFLKQKSATGELLIALFVSSSLPGTGASLTPKATESFNVAGSDRTA